MLGNIHPGLVNVETWTVGVHVNIGTMSLNALDWQEEQIQRRTELELTPAQARLVAYRLLAAADEAETQGEGGNFQNPTK